jgi:glutathione S-transferase
MVPPHLRDDHDRWVFEEMQTRARGPWHVLEQRRPEFKEDMEKHLAMVDAMLDGRDWILGEPSLADFGIYGGMFPLLFVGEKVPKGLPNLAWWVRRVRSL